MVFEFDIGTALVFGISGALVGALVSLVIFLVKYQLAQIKAKKEYKEGKIFEVKEKKENA